jgi:hypothetical protein
MAKKGKLSQIITTPTDDRRHVSKIRFGKVSAEVYCKDPKRREELGLPPKTVDPDY